MAIEVIERHISPDGVLICMLAKEGEDWITGLESSLAPGFFDWHTHGSLLTEGTELGPEQVSRGLVDEILQDKVLIVICQSGEKIHMSLTCAPEFDLQNKDQDETITFRFWSGSKLYHGDEILSSNEVWRGFW